MDMACTKLSAPRNSRENQPARAYVLSGAGRARSALLHLASETPVSRPTGLLSCFKGAGILNPPVLTF